MSGCEHPGLPPSGPRPPDDFFRAVEIVADRQPAPASRLYHVRPSRPEDHPLLLAGEADATQLLTIVRLDGAKLILSKAWPWADTDAWAGWRWRKADRERWASVQQGGPV